MIDIIPAIDLMDGKCVRLSQGNFDSKKVYSADPVDMAKRFEDYGFRRLHLVDLDGAERGRLKHFSILEKISVKTGLLTDFGGGIKSLSDVKSVIEAGAYLVCIGSMAVKDEKEFDSVIEKYGADSVLLAADTRNGELAISGWKESAGIPLLDFIEKMTGKNITRILCTEVDKDGMLEGTALSLYEGIMDKFPGLYLIASGGVSGIEDIRALEEASVPAVVFGKAFYENRLKIEDLKSFL
jgi:phosphoribosylformimino-5-aminoimidazole carboxamide ribotide isomerase